MAKPWFEFEKLSDLEHTRFVRAVNIAAKDAGVDWDPVIE
jgi:hypothetical protein